MKCDVVLGLDISSTNTGVCLLDLEGNYLFSYLIKSKKKDFEERVIDIGEELFIIVDSIGDKIKAIGIESVSFFSKGKVAQLAMQNGYYFYTLKNKGYNVKTYTPSSIKKFYCGNGRAKKEDMLKNTPKDVIEDFLLVDNKKIDDLVDAYAIAKLTLKSYKENV